MKRFTTITLGCKVNQCESAAICQRLSDSGLQAVHDQIKPDVVVINTCTVTGKAAMQSRQAVRQAIRKYPQAQIIVTGCYAQTAPEEIQAMPGVDLVVGHEDKLRLDEVISRGAPNLSPLGPRSRTEGDSCEFSALPSIAREDRTRAFLKIQDGCNTRCTYCIVPYARGNSRSMPPAEVLDHLRQLGRDGIKEVVLTGIHLGAYGSDFRPPMPLPVLLQSINAEGPVHRIRLSSIEPTEVDSRLIELIAFSHGKLCRHLHIPLQSGDDTILRRMGRPYSREQFAQVIKEIHRQMPEAAIGVDVMAGFPGETDEAFENSYHLIEELPVTYLHVFPFSARKGTPAAGFKPKVPERISKDRCLRLRLLGQAKQKAFYQSMVGRHLEVLIESNENGRAKGWSDNYLPVIIPEVLVEANHLVMTQIIGLNSEGEVVAHLVNKQ